MPRAKMRLVANAATVENGGVVRERGPIKSLR
jgi:hypothetical protein